MPDSNSNSPLPSRSVIGILGSGQLGKMLAQAASRLGFRTHVYSNDAGPALDVATQHSIGSFTSFGRLDEFAGSVDVVTYEFENVPVAAAEHLSREVPVRPGARALAVSQDRITEKTFIRDLGIAVAPFAAIRNSGDIATAASAQAAWNAGAILKTARLGYDGKGQASIRNPTELAAAFDTLGSVPCVLEQRLDFQCEVSVLVVRAVDGQTVTYDIPVNEHAGGILRRSTVPANLPPNVETRARAMACRIADALDYIGVLAVEMFYLGDSVPEPLIVNEIAPRVHNSGHWTMDACAVGQFENHIRAVAGWPLGATERHSDAIMRNLIGQDVDAWPSIAAEPQACLHLYGKREAREGRKMGHVNYLKRLTAS
ncbi:MAG: 5-(carboxyamino)imidazole ribonucleotide synthase [Hyphomicrobiaceae bacterium]